MKKIITIILGISLCLTATAQTNSVKQQGQRGKKEFNKEEMIEKRCKAVVEKLMLDETTSAKFVVVYKAYMNELGDNFAMAPKKDAEVSDADIDAKIKENFVKARQMIDVREKYYNEFRTFLTAKQARMALDVRGRQGMEKGKFQKDGKKNFRNEAKDDKQEKLRKRLEFSHDKKKLNESSTN